MDFQILGPVEIRAGDRRVECTRAKERLLLGVLILHANEVVSSDRLIDALWGARPPRSAAKALQVHVSQLRKLLEPDRAPGAPGHVLATRPPGYELRLEPEQLDLWRFERAVAEARAAADTGRADAAASGFRDALSIWRGPPLADLALEEAVQPDIARLEELRLAAFEDRIDADLALGRHADVVGELEGMISQHPLRERPRGQLMVALYRSGRQADALEAFRAARRLLVDELGIEPSRRLKELEAAILNQDEALEARLPVASEVLPLAPSREFVGRRRELGAAVAQLERALSGDAALVLIAGEPGIGKSRLAEELAAEARKRGARIVVGRCWEAGGAPPYWPWVQALRSCIRGSDTTSLRARAAQGAAELAVLLPELRETLGESRVQPALESDGARFRLFEAVASFICGTAAVQPLAVFLDDLHAADPASLLLLRFVARELTDASCFLVGCYRDSDTRPELREAVEEISREAAVVRLALSGLDVRETSQLLELTLGHAPAHALSARVHEETDGNPLFATEIGRLLAAEGAAPETTRGGLPIPARVSEAIERRVERRSRECRDVLALASVIGREFELDVLACVSGLGEDETFDAVEEASAARLVGPVPGGGDRLRFSHVVIRDALFEALPPTRRMRLHRAIGEAIEDLYAGNLEPRLSELAHHYVAGGSGARAKAIEFSLRAGDQAASQLGYEQAARHYETGLRLLDASGEEDATRRCELHLALGDALSRAGEGSDAKAEFRRAAELAEATGRSDLLARAALGYAGRFAWLRGSSDPALVLLYERALAAVGEGDSPVRVRLLARLAAALRDEPVRDRRVAIADEALAMARRLGDPVTLAHALDGHWPAVEGPDSVGSRIGRADELLALAEAAGDSERAFQAHDYRLHTFWVLCDRQGVELELDALRHIAEELRQPAQRWHHTASRAVLALMEGRLADAEQLIEAAHVLGERAQSWNARISRRLSLFVLRRQQGRLAEMEAAIRRSVHEYPALRRFRCALAHVLAESEAREEAREVVDGLVAGAVGREHVDEEWLFGMSLLPDACRVLADTSAASKLYPVLLRYERLYAEAPVEGIFGSVARGVGVLAVVLDRLDDAERHLELAIATERRMGARPWLAHAQHELADVLLARARPGDRERGSRLLDEAAAGYRALGMSPWAERAETARR